MVSTQSAPLPVPKVTNFVELQRRHKKWLEHNFPNQQSQSHHGLLGLTEEVGELAHAHLKLEQGIRGNEDLVAQRDDACGDIVIYLLSYCNTNGIDLATAIADAWAEVEARDWIAFPGNGVSH